MDFLTLLFVAGFAYYFYKGIQAKGGQDKSNNSVKTKASQDTLADLVPTKVSHDKQTEPEKTKENQDKPDELVETFSKINNLIEKCCELSLSEKTLNCLSEDDVELYKSIISPYFHEAKNIDDYTEKFTNLFSAIRASFLIIYLSRKRYLKPLNIKYNQLKYKDSYGDVVFDAVENEFYSFINKRRYEIINETDSKIKNNSEFIREISSLSLKEKIPNYLYSNLYYASNDNDNECEIYNIIIDLLMICEEYSNFNHEENNESEIVAPLEYEKNVASIFNSLGWKTVTTKSSGDQGADVIAEKNGLTLVVQCKLYSGTVGNKAVQEVAAARGFYQADGAIVVSNSSYTKSALQLAESLNVLMLHHDQISTLDELFSNASSDEI